MRALAIAGVVLAVTAIASPAYAQYEDQPGWDCHTMGNHVCGPVAPVSRFEDEVSGWDCRTMGNRVCAPAGVVLGFAVAGQVTS